MTATRKTGRVVAAAVVGVIGLVAIVGFLVLRSLTATNPQWQSLQASPDSALHGTFAYFDDDSMCVRLISASGAATREVLCVDPDKTTDPANKSKYVGIHIHWLADNRLELTMWSMNAKTSQPTFAPAWQKVYNPATGELTETPAAEIAPTPAPNPKPQTNPAGERLSTESDMGHVVVKLTSSAGIERTLIDVQGGPETYGMSDAFWSPDGKYVISEDYQVLITTVGAQPVTRRLTDPTTTFYGYDEIDWFAVTAADLL